MEIGKEWTGQNEKDDELFRIIKAMFSRYYNRNLLTEAGQNNFIKLKDNNLIKKVILCSGKIYFDLLEAREKNKKDDVVFYRIEQLYPFPVKNLVSELKKYSKNAKFFWCQEEPKNMGAWFAVRDYIQWTLDYIKAKNRNISYIGRNPAASPATGYAKRHISQQQDIIKEVLKDE